MAVEVPPPKRRASGLRRVRDARDLRPRVEQPAGRRMDANGVYLSPIRQLTTNIVETYRICNPQFRYESTHNPRRVLTKPSKPMHNDGYDNEDYDYILYVNDWLGGDDGRKYLILDILGQGTFGQVVKCQNMQTHEVVAVKVVKNKPAYFNQSMMEVTILELLNNQCDPKDEHHILRLHDSFIHKNHLCLVFELLSSNLYELIKQNQFQGLSTQLVKVFTAQLLDALTVLKEARLIHCDLKPENILLKSLQSPQIKVIDFGSACHERQTVYTYIQSRFYRSPEVLLGIPYTAAIDMWSLGCIAVELFLGLPLFPGTSEYNQITRIVDMLGQPPQYMLDMGKQTSQFFDSFVDGYGQKKYKLKSIEQYSREHNTQEQPGKQYFKANTLHDIINQAPMPTFKSSRQAHEVDKEMNNRASFIDFCKGLLNMNPIERWSPQQARLHPFITGEKWTKPWTVGFSRIKPHRRTDLRGSPVVICTLFHLRAVVPTRSGHTAAWCRPNRRAHERTRMRRRTINIWPSIRHTQRRPKPHRKQRRMCTGIHILPRRLRSRAPLQPPRIRTVVRARLVARPSDRSSQRPRPNHPHIVIWLRRVLRDRSLLSILMSRSTEDLVAGSLHNLRLLLLRLPTHTILAHAPALTQSTP
ncbi:kinase-like protein [Wolfiporia cocos MD-104 SS10]|uniref:Kinase-like protein n=1 Tax=Wolfiporia cocos (strain MD-104) TaxID=742152 RepID=A0A2H3K3J4_WOLCO|nr:kinase-like protein [Wolfiporia cocos MD-104 SS10]